MNDWLRRILEALTPDALHDLLSGIGVKGYRMGFDAGFADTDGEYKAGAEDIDHEAIAAIGLRTHALSDSTMAHARSNFAVEAGKLQNELNAAIASGMSEKEALKKIQPRVAALFDNAFPEWKVERLARDQFLVATKEGRRDAWQKRGVAFRQWHMHLDSHTGEDSKRMHGQITEIDQPYTDPETGDKYMLPHIRPNDRCYEIPLKKLPKNLELRDGLRYAPIQRATYSEEDDTSS